MSVRKGAQDAMAALTTASTESDDDRTSEFERELNEVDSVQSKTYPGGRNNDDITLEEDNGKVFLGGTTNSRWRESLKPKLKVKHYDPVVDDWGMETQRLEEDTKQKARENAFVITPKQQGFFAIAELTKSATTEPERTSVAFVDEDEGEQWDEAGKKSIDQVKELAKSTGAAVFDDVDELAEHLNQKGEPAEVPREDNDNGDLAAGDDE